jgi:hypothetical protein
VVPGARHWPSVVVENGGDENCTKTETHKIIRHALRESLEYLVAVVVANQLGKRRRGTQGDGDETHRAMAMGCLR